MITIKAYKRVRIVLWTFLLVMLPLVKSMALQVNDFTFSHIGTDEGIGTQRVFCVKQSLSGAIWWATTTGICRYNGSKVKNYSLDKDTPYAHLGGRFIRLATDSTSIYTPVRDKKVV